MTAQTAAAYLDMAPQTFYKLKIQAISLNARAERRYLRDDLDTFLEQLRESPLKGR